MSFLPLNEQNQQGPTGQTTNAPQAGTPPPQSGGSTGAGTAGGAAGNAPNTGSATQFGSSASKLGDYLSANAPQIQNQANAITSGLNQQYGNIQNDITNASNQFGTQISGGYTAANPDIVKQATANPTGFVSNPENISAFQGQYNDAYTGPKSFTGSTPYSNIQNEVGQAVQKSGNLGTQAGLQSYLGGATAGNQTQASNTLDALLMQGNPAAQAQIQQASQQFQGLPGQLAKNTAGLDAAAAAAGPAAQAAQDYARSQFGNAANTFNTGLQTKLDAANAGNTKYNTDLANLRSQLTGGNFAGAPGISTGLQNFLTNNINPWNTANPGGSFAPNYVNALPSNINPQMPQLGQVANTQDYATLAALGQLGGSPINSPLTAATANQAGTYQAPTLGNVNNKTIAQDLLDAYSGENQQVGSDAYHQYMNNQQALNNYLGNNLNAFYGQQPNQPGNIQNPYGTIPVIQDQMSPGGV